MLEPRGLQLAALACLLVACSSEGDPKDDEGSGGSGGSAACFGPTPPQSAWSATPGPTDGGGGASAAMPEVGQPPPDFQLEDFQPQSCGYEAVYGLEAFQGRVTIAALWAGWCPYCQSQAVNMERMRLELSNEGHDIHIVGINSTDAVDNQKQLTDRSKAPMLQDLDEIGAWDRLGGAKDDFYIYDKNGVLVDYLGPGGISSNLGTDEGYENVKAAIIAAFE